MLDVVLLQNRKTLRPMLREVRQDFKVGLHERLNARFLNFHDDLAAVNQTRGVHLADGGTPQRRAIE